MIEMVRTDLSTANIAITFDVDWASDPVLDDTLELLAKYGVNATFFATHQTNRLENPDRHEVGIHPNFRDMKASQFRPAIEALLNMYPQAAGVRTHAYWQSNEALVLFSDFKLAYDSSVLMYRCSQPYIFNYWTGLARVPVYWEDDVHAVLGDEWNVELLDCSNPLLIYVFDFHPIHVFLNTESIDRYEAARGVYKDFDALQSRRNVDGPGTRTFLENLLAARFAAGRGQCTIMHYLEQR